MTDTPIWEKVLLTREEAMQYSNIGANTLVIVK